MNEDQLAIKENSALAIPDSAVIEQVALHGDLSKLTPEMRVAYYGKVCESLKLNPFTRPFIYVTLNGQLRLYATKDCSEQLRQNHQISIKSVTREVANDILMVGATGEDLRTGREDYATGCVSIKGLGGDALANAYMKAETKAKRRLTLSICGLGMDSEDDLPPGAVVVNQALPVIGQPLTGPVNSQVLTGAAEPDPFANAPAAAPPVVDVTPEQRQERIKEAVAQGDENARKAAGTGKRGSRKAAAPTPAPTPGPKPEPPPAPSAPAVPPPPPYVASPDDVDF